VADTDPEVVKSKEELLTTVATLKRATADAGGRLSALETASQELTSKYRELRAADARNQTFTPHGTDNEARNRYCLAADAVKAQVIDTSTAPQGGQRETVRYAAIDKGELSGREFLAGKSAPHAIRMLGEWDEDGHVEYGLLDDPEPATAWQHRLQEIVEMRSLARMFLTRPGRYGGVEQAATPKLDRMLQRHLLRGPDWVRQVFADNAGEGGEFVPDIVLPELGRIVELPRSVAGLFDEMMIPTGGTTRMPYLVSGCQPFLVGVPAAGDLDPADIQRSVPSTTDLTAVPFTWGVSLPANRDMIEDSIIQWGRFGSLMLAEAERDGEEDYIINGDTNGGDTGLASWNPRGRWGTLGHSRDHRKSGIGLRHFSIDVGSSGSLAAETAVGLQAEQIHLDSPQAMANIAHITSPEWFLLKLLTDTNLLTVDKYGDLATLRTGEVAKVFGKPVVISEFVDKEYNASGIYDHATRTKTGVISVNTSRWKRGIRRGPRTEAETRPSQHVVIVTMTRRWTLQHVGRSTEKSVTWQYNASAS
jgi:hypothetical protein